MKTGFAKLINAIFNVGRAEVLQQAGEVVRKKEKEEKLVDLAHEALAERASEDKRSLDGLVNLGSSEVGRRKFKRKVRSKVWDVVSKDFGSSSSEMVDEITDRIVDVAEVDEYYKQMFEEGTA